MKNRIQVININLYLGLIILLYIFIGILLNWYIVTDEHYYRYLVNQLDVERISQFLILRNKWDWVGFLIIPVFTMIKILFVATCLEVGSFIVDLKLKFKQLFKIVVLAETIFVISAFIRVGWLFLFSEHLTLEYIQYFQPLSLFNLVVFKKIPQYLIYPLQVVNVFEVIYWVVLAYLIKIHTDKSFDRSLGFITSTYGIGLFAWVVLFTFLSIN